MPHPKMLLGTLEAFQIVGIKMDQTKNKVDTKMDMERECSARETKVFFFFIFPFSNLRIRNDSPRGSHSCLTSILHGAHNIPSMNSDCSPVSIIKAIQWSTRSQRLDILAHARRATLLGSNQLVVNFKTGIVQRKSRVKVENDSPAGDL